LCKFEEHKIDFVESTRHYTVTLQVEADAKLKSHNFNLFAVRDAKQFGEGFGYTNFSAVTLEFTRCVTPMRRLWEETVILLSWTNPISTLTFLCAASFVIYFSQWIMLILGIILWTPLKKFVIGSLITIEMPNTSDYVVEEFKKNLAFIQMMETSYVELIKSCQNMFEGVNRNSLNKAVDLLKILPLFSLLTWLYIPQSARIAMLICFWLAVLACHPLGHQITHILLIRLQLLTLNEPGATKSATSQFVDQMAKKVSTFTGSPLSSHELIRDVVVFENQRWWLGVGFVPKFIMDGSHFVSQNVTRGQTQLALKRRTETSSSPSSTTECGIGSKTGD
jgi:Integral peroxisomal membrane peroxin